MVNSPLVFNREERYLCLYFLTRTKRNSGTCLVICQLPEQLLLLAAGRIMAVSDEQHHWKPLYSSIVLYTSLHKMFCLFHFI